MLALYKLNSTKHSGVRSFFNLHLVKTGLVSVETAHIYNDLFDRRQEVDYEDFFVFKEEDVLPWIDETAHFVAALQKLALSKLNDF